MDRNINIDEKFTYEILGCAYDAFKIVGVGFSELHYHKIFHNILIQKGIKAQYRVPVHLEYKNENIADFEIDEIIEDKLVVELKCIQTDFIPENYAQILTYLKATQIRFGFLINFGLHKAIPDRIIFDEIRTANVEFFDEPFFKTIPSHILFDTVLSSLREIDSILGVAYHNKIYQAAFAIEMKNKQIRFDRNVQLNINIQNTKFLPYEIDYWLVENSLLIGILAGKHKPKTHDFLRMRSYLKYSNLHHGLIAFWSNENLQLYGIYEP